jgi:shikimate dehydrogenase
MHNTLFNHLKLDYDYQLHQVTSDELDKFVAKELRVEKVRGANVTVPHKVAIIPFLDELDISAKRLGAVNTIINNNGQLKGYNTDGSAALRALTEVYGPVDEASIVMLGAGGAAHAVGCQLSHIAKELIIINRNNEKAEKLALYLQQGTKNKVYSIKKSQLKSSIKSADILINTTSVGMTPNLDETPIDPLLLHQNLFVFDVVYNPEKTRLIQDAELVGARTLTGIKMLVYQGSAAFKLWTGITPPETLMMKAVKDYLEVQN